MTKQRPDFSNLSEHALSFGKKPAKALPADPKWGPDMPPGLAAVDERWQQMVGTKSDLEEVVAQLADHERTPEKVARMLLTARLLFVHGYFVHEFAFVGAVWSVFAVEAALKDVLGLPDDDRTSLKKLVGKAQSRGWLTSEEAGRLQGGAEMRNALVHARGQGTFTVGLASGVLEASHEFVWTFYNRAQPKVRE